MCCYDKILVRCVCVCVCSGVPRIFFSGGGSTNSVEDRGEREWGSGGVAPYSGVLEAAVIWYNKFHFIQ